jgi:hypothetical protein
VVFLLVARDTGRIIAMRTILVILVTLLAAPAFAQGWEAYDNARFGYSIDIPPGFEVASEADNGDGASFYSEAGAMDLYVWGANLLEDFASEAEQAQAFATEQGYNLTYQATTPQWTSFSGSATGKIMYQRMQLLCDGQSWAAFRVEYGTRDVGEMNAVIERLVQSLRGDC